MHRQLRAGVGALGLCAVVVVSGCLNVFSDKSLKYVGRADFQHYRDVATRIDFPDVDEPTDSDALLTAAPRRIRHLDAEQEMWDVSLSDVLHLALAHSRMIRTRAQFLSPQNTLLANPDFVPSVYDPAIQDSGVLLGNRGVEAALADFDAQATTSMLWGRNETIQNSGILSGGVPGGETLTDETGVFASRLEKQMATGGLFAVQHNWNYSLNNVPSRLFQSAYTGLMRAEYRQPLWAGSGTEFTRIAGPLRTSLTGVSGVNQGVVIARINNDISLADFEAAVGNLLKDAEDLYWELALAYRVYHSEVVARNSALETWRVVRAKQASGLAGAADEAQAGDNYFETRARAETALADLYQTESQLRRLVGLPVNDGRILRPTDEPAIAEFLPDWYIALAEALTSRVELRRQKWNIKSLNLQLKAAHSLTKPRLDFVSSYQVNAFGDQLFGVKDNDGITTQGLRSAYETLTQGDQTGWNLGFEFTSLLGYRAAHAQVRNVELRLAKARAALAAQELEISHELSIAFQGLDRWYGTAQSNFNRRQNAQRRVKAFEAEYATDRTSLDLVLRAQISLSQAEIAYYRSLMEYNKSITDIHYRKGTLLAENNVHLSEGLWKPEAYRDALRRAWARSHAFNKKHVHTEPAEFVAGGFIEDAVGTRPTLPVPPDFEQPLSRPTDDWQQAPAPEPLESDPSTATPHLLPIAEELHQRLTRELETAERETAERETATTPTAPPSHGQATTPNRRATTPNRPPAEFTPTSSPSAPPNRPTAEPGWKPRRHKSRNSTGKED